MALFIGMAESLLLEWMIHIKVNVVVLEVVFRDLGAR